MEVLLGEIVDHLSFQEMPCPEHQAGVASYRCWPPPWWRLPR
jgi:hypothetical protein